MPDSMTIPIWYSVLQLFVPAITTIGGVLLGGCMSNKKDKNNAQLKENADLAQSRKEIYKKISNAIMDCLSVASPKFSMHITEIETQMGKFKKPEEALMEALKNHEISESEAQIKLDNSEKELCELESKIELLEKQKDLCEEATNRAVTVFKENTGEFALLASVRTLEAYNSFYNSIQGCDDTPNEIDYERLNEAGMLLIANMKNDIGIKDKN